MTIEKRLFYKIEYENCELEYNYTICEAEYISVNIDAAIYYWEQHPDAEELEGSIKITPVFLTEEEFKEETKYYGDN